MNHSQSMVFFDGVCNLCNGFVQFVLKNEVNSNYQFCSLQSEFAINFFKEKQFLTCGIDSVIVFENNQFYIESAAAFKIISKLKWPYRVFGIFAVLPNFINNFIYKLIAKYRYKIFGKSNVCWVMSDKNKLRFL
ncbi:MAG: thiol-disulfide oxidoreductase DCC family protein [Bacteroidia bacterium]